MPFDANARLMVIAPHPDDETLATGELIQAAVEAGAAVRVVFATDGDNNPWPQRLLERRFRIGPADRSRWGARRRAEARAALQRLGVGDDASRCFGWPDLGLTDRLLRDDRAETALADEIRAFAPTHLALPSLADRHPDHTALRVLTELALLRVPMPCLRLGYVVHGDASRRSGAWSLPPQPSRQRIKQQALAEHRSQVALSGPRLRRIAAQAELFERREPALFGESVRDELQLMLPVSPLDGLRRRRDLLLVLVGATAVIRARVALPRRLHGEQTLAVSGAPGLLAFAQRGRDGVQVRIDGIGHDMRGGWFKLERAWPRLLIFDEAGWQALGAVDGVTAPAGFDEVLPDAR